MGPHPYMRLSKEDTMVNSSEYITPGCRSECEGCRIIITSYADIRILRNYYLYHSLNLEDE